MSKKDGSAGSSEEYELEEDDYWSRGTRSDNMASQKSTSTIRRTVILKKKVYKKKKVKRKSKSKKRETQDDDKIEMEKEVISTNEMNLPETPQTPTPLYQRPSNFSDTTNPSAKAVSRQEITNAHANARMGTSQQPKSKRDIMKQANI